MGWLLTFIYSVLEEYILKTCSLHSEHADAEEEEDKPQSVIRPL